MAGIVIIVGGIKKMGTFFVKLWTVAANRKPEFALTTVVCEFPIYLIRWLISLGNIESHLFLFVAEWGIDCKSSF